MVLGKSKKCHEKKSYEVQEGAQLWPKTDPKWEQNNWPITVDLEGVLSLNSINCRS